MDSIDLKIITALKKNAKQNTKEIANQVGLSVSPTFQRIKKLEKQKIIRGYVAIVDQKKLGNGIIAFCQISIAKHSKKTIDRFKAEIDKINEVLECNHVSGNFDFLLKIAVTDMDHYHKIVVEKITLIAGVSNIKSNFIIEKSKNEYLK
ncbi:Lrp/AsnC family transcriptional regulator [Aquimarina agarilytica]|uniref:Lrp/AsnC family transcriptional regulator n=1 Tax=Aquimarina agarilytica TaxID=1087449 RepID=UPI0002889C90|nr:Lrp/AsnC family transcriptional regulator [Aquimarina agarilytica]